MSKKTDVIVIGSGLAGLMAALAAGKRGCGVRVFSYGMGSLAISPGVIDVLGYDALGNRLDNPWSGFASLAPGHPYSLLGQPAVEAALAELVAALGDSVTLHNSVTGHGMPRNTDFPTVMGTLKPTYLYQADQQPEALANAKRILVITVTGFRDCKPALIIQQLRRYPAFADKEFAAWTLPSPFNERGRSLNALDLAHVADREDGCAWLLDAIRGRGKNFDIALLPPMLGSTARPEIRKLASEALGCPMVEMLSVPPSVGGLRIRDALVSRLLDLGVSFYENAQVQEGSQQADGMIRLTVQSSRRKVQHDAKAVVVATGGILGGGVLLAPGSAREAIFGIKINVPENVDQWSMPEIFGQHLVTSLGVEVDSALRATGRDGAPLYNNVFFAGRTLGGYDYAAEKSGHGVAVASGWKAGNMAASIARPETGADAVAGDSK